MGAAMAKESHFYDYSSPHSCRKRNSDPTSSNSFSKEYAQYWQQSDAKTTKPPVDKNSRSWTIDKSQYPFYDQSNRYHLTQRQSSSAPAATSQYGGSFSPKEKFANDFSITTNSTKKK